MPGTAVVGLQFGDEGKGKIVDVLAEEADLVVRFNGGANAGHTVQVGDEKFAFRLLPSGIIRPKVLNVIGNGVAVDPVQLLEEVDDLRKRGYPVNNLRISDRAHVVMPWHKALDALAEEAKGGLAAETTRRGIGPVFEDKVGRWGIRMCDLLDNVVLRRKLESIVPAKQKVATALGGTETFAIDRVSSQYREHGERLREFVADTSLVVNDALKRGKTVLFEGAQGTLLCVDHGLYPYGTSSACVAGAATVGAGVGPQAIGRVVGVVKAFTSRVGAGPFPTQIEDKTAEYLRERGGGEYGTVTRRPRRIGWLDMVMLRHSARVNGLTDLAVTKIDVLGGLETVKAAKAYKRFGKRVPEFPADSFALADCKPVYEEFDGWEDLPAPEWRRIARKGSRSLPKNGRTYLEWISRTLEVPFAFVSVGQGREDTIDLRKQSQSRGSQARRRRSPAKSPRRPGSPRRASR